MIFNKEFTEACLAKDKNCEFLAYVGQPMLYDWELYVLRREHKELDRFEYLRWVRGIRVA